eukprot:6361093-Amphidinium_carterae.2
MKKCQRALDEFNKFRYARSRKISKSWETVVTRTRRLTRARTYARKSLNNCPVHRQHWWLRVLGPENFESVRHSPDGILDLKDTAYM